MKWACLVTGLMVGIVPTTEAGGPPPMYVIVERVDTEQGKDSLTSIRIWGCFTRLEKGSHEKFTSPVYGFIEFGAGADADAPKWRKAAGTGKPVAVGSCADAGAFLTTTIHPTKVDEKTLPARSPYPKEKLELWGSLFADGRLAEQKEVKTLLAFAKLRKAAIPDFREFIEDSITAGLKEDGVPRSFIAQLAKNPDFLGKCSLCQPTHNALVKYSLLEKQPEGKGLNADLQKRLSSEVIPTRHAAIRDLVANYIERGYARSKLGPDHQIAMQKKLDEERGQGSGGLVNGQKFCPSCDGVCRVMPKK